jgi:hypothetical protein
MSILKASGAALLTSALLCSLLHATVLQHRDLSELAHDAATVFVGSCLSVSPGSARFDGAGELGYIEYTFQVHEWIKGNQRRGMAITFRQPRALPGRGRLFVTADEALLRPPVYAAGQKYLLFLYAPDKWGLTSPVGAVQGSFAVHAFPSGEEVAVNGINNLGLTGLGKGAMKLDKLVPMTREVLR